VRVLVTGADGFVGRHLVAHLIEAGDEVVEAVGPHVAAAGSAAPLDIRDRAAVAALIDRVQPEAIYHLAAVAYGPDAGADPRGALDITVGGTINVLEAASRGTASPTVLVPGSSEVYGSPQVDVISEATPIRPVNLYGATKAAQEAVALAYHASAGLPVIATRSFNHIGPGQRDSFAVPSFARQLREIANGKRDELLVGNLEPVRDFTDVRDVVVAYRSLVVGGHAGQPINVASGQGISMRAMLDRLIMISGLDIRVRSDPDRVRPQDPSRLVGDATRLRQLTGWRPRRTLDETLTDVWTDAQARFAAGSPS
jgi:GDP-4-dehydro-6-deoxy-D-mannose reductase